LKDSSTFGDAENSTIILRKNAEIILADAENAPKIQPTEIFWIFLIAKFFKKIPKAGEAQVTG